MNKAQCVCVCCSYFNADSDDEQEVGGASEEVLRQQMVSQLHGDAGEDESDNEDDPLDAFMAGIQVCVCVWVFRMFVTL